MRVLFVPQLYPSPYSHGVAGTFVREHARAAARFVEVVVLNPVYAGRGNPLQWRLDARDDEGIRTFDLVRRASILPWTTRLFRKRTLTQAIERVVRETGSFDVIHSEDLQAENVLDFCKASSTPFVVSQHWTGFIRNDISPPQLRRLRAAFAQASFVLPAHFQSEGVYEQFQMTPKVRWLPNAYDPAIFHDNAQPLKRRELSLLHVSGLTQQKRVPDILHAFARVQRNNPGAYLHLIGDGSNRREVEELAATLLPPDSYTFHRHLPKSEVAQRMRSVRGLVFPSEYETFGCVLMEAQACGLPVLTTLVGGIPAVVDEADALMVPVGDIEAIAHSMERLLHVDHDINPAKLADDMRARFSHEVIGRQLEEIYRNCVAAGFGPSRARTSTADVAKAKT